MGTFVVSVTIRQRDSRMGDKRFKIYEIPANKINSKAIYPWTILTVSSVPELTYSIDTKDVQFSISNQQHRDITVQRWVPDLM
jgi:hypothetical protein